MKTIKYTGISASRLMGLQTVHAQDWTETEGGISYDDLEWVRLVDRVAAAFGLTGRVQYAVSHCAIPAPARDRHGFYIPYGWQETGDKRGLTLAFYAALIPALQVAARDIRVEFGRPVDVGAADHTDGSFDYYDLAAGSRSVMDLLGPVYVYLIETNLRGEHINAPMLRWLKQIFIRWDGPEIKSDTYYFAGVYIPELELYLTHDATHREEGIERLEQYAASSGMTDWWRRVLEYRPLAKMPAPSRRKPAVRPTLGADPELTVLNDRGNVIPAASLASSTSAEIGCDGSGDQLELRPSPARTARGLVKNTAALMRECARRWPDLTLSHVGDRLSLGCHIHVANVPDQYPPPDLIMLLDDFLGRPLLGLSGAARARCGYRRLGAVEGHKSHGGWEYRTLPSEIMESPKLMEAVAHGIQTLVRRYYSGRTFKYDERHLGFQDYHTYCGWSMEQYARFKEAALKHLALTPDALVENWRLKPNRRRRGRAALKMIFNDEWDSDIAADFETLIKAGLRRRRFKPAERAIIFQPQAPVFYGLRAERGFAFSWASAIPGASWLEESERPVQWNKFGLPHAFRNMRETYMICREQAAREIVAILANGARAAAAARGRI